MLTLFFSSRLFFFNKVRKLSRCITLEELKGLKGSTPVLSEMILLNRGRLSVQPVSVEEWEFILGLE